jgi:hypothetical protein
MFKDWATQFESFKNVIQVCKFHILGGTNDEAVL